MWPKNAHSEVDCQFKSNFSGPGGGGGGEIIIIDVKFNTSRPSDLNIWIHRATRARNR